MVPYLARLGVSHVYASHFFALLRGAFSAMIVCDHNELIPEVSKRWPILKKVEVAGAARTFRPFSPDNSQRC